MDKERIAERKKLPLLRECRRSIKKPSVLGVHSELLGLVVKQAPQ